MSSREFVEWMAFYTLEPFGEERDDLRAAVVAKTIVDVNTAKGRRAKLEDFMPHFDPPVEQDVGDMLQVVEQMNVAFGGVDNRKED